MSGFSIEEALGLYDKPEGPKMDDKARQDEIQKAYDSGDRQVMLEVAAKFAIKDLSSLADQTALTPVDILLQMSTHFFPDVQTSFSDYNDFVGRWYRFSSAVRQGRGGEGREGMQNRRRDLQEAWKRLSLDDKQNVVAISKQIGALDILGEQIVSEGELKGLMGVLES